MSKSVHNNSRIEVLNLISIGVLLGIITGWPVLSMYRYPVDNFGTVVGENPDPPYTFASINLLLYHLSKILRAFF